LRKALGSIQLPQELRQNVVPGILIAQTLGISEKNIEESLSSLTPSDKTMKIVRGRGGASVIDDSHNASEMGVATAISFLSSMPQKNKILIMPCIIELGEESKEAHRRIGTMLKKSNINAIITTRDYFEEIVEVASRTNVLLITNPNEVIAHIKDILSEDCVIVLEGKIHPDIISFILQKERV
jgi:UDP-N-acetylmuramoyl-tripeptide--D-alanyl-D-alanine ligase